MLGINFRPNGNAGIIVTAVIPGGTASAAGLEQGDIILSIDGSFINGENIVEIMSEYEAGDSVELGVLREGETLNLEATLGMEIDSSGMVESVLGIEFEADGEIGLIVTAVAEDSVAENSGVEVGDILVSINGRFVGVDHIIPALTMPGPRPIFMLGVVRDGITLNLGSMRELDIRGDFGNRRNAGYLGISLESNEDGGALIAEVQEGSPAAEAGLEPGDIIRKVDELEIRNVLQVIEAIQRREPGDDVPLLLDRDGSSRLIVVTLGERPTE